MEKTKGDCLYDAVDDAVKVRIDAVEVFSEIASTNSYLLNLPAPERGRCRIALAEHQSAGRGQRGSVWESPRQAGLYLSIVYTFAEAPRVNPCLTLAVGIGLAEALIELGATCKLKWPNDLVLNDGKLGGILTELLHGKDRETTVVVGIGLNLDFGAQLDSISTGIGKVSDLKQAMEELPEREDIARLIIDNTIRALVDFDARGFSQFQQRWTPFDWLFGKAVHVAMAEGDIYGIASGIDDDGALLVDRDGATERIVSGTVVLHDGDGNTR